MMIAAASLELFVICLAEVCLALFAVCGGIRIAWREQGYRVGEIAGGRQAVSFLFRKRLT